MFLEPKQLDALRRIEQRTGAPMASQIRIAIDRWLKTEDKKPVRKPPVTRARS